MYAFMPEQHHDAVSELKQPVHVSTGDLGCYSEKSPKWSLPAGLVGLGPI